MYFMEGLKMKNDILDAVLMTEEQKTRQDKRKANRKKKLVVEVIKGHILCGNVKKAIDIAEANGIDSKEFGKITKEVGEMQ